MLKELIAIQNELKAPKNKYNSFGNYNYRNAESIMEGVKPLLKKHNCTLKMSEEMLEIGDRYYIKSTATLVNSEGESESSTSYAREQSQKKGMDEAQITGATISYARKYALGGLLMLDDNIDDDPDAKDNTGEPSNAPKKAPVKSTSKSGNDEKSATNAKSEGNGAKKAGSEGKNPDAPITKGEIEVIKAGLSQIPGYTDDNIIKYINGSRVKVGKKLATKLEDFTMAEAVKAKAVINNKIDKISQEA